MISQEDKPRNLVPRWRSLSQTIAARELAAPKANAIARHSQTPPELLEKSQYWLRDPSILTAAEFVESAVVHGFQERAVDAARLLVSSSSTATSLVRKNAVLLLQAAGDTETSDSIGVPSAPATLSAWRARTRGYPHDALAWLELALAHVSGGQNQKAERSVLVALRLAPENRHVLRSASRLFLHLGDAERAHDIVRNSPATKHDPWLVAAEIALAEQAERKARFVQDGIRTLEAQQHQPRHVSELAGAVATRFARDGNRKRSRRLFGTSLLDPTANSLAQAEWASKEFGEALVSEPQLLRGDAHEASAFHAFWRGNFRRSFQHAKRWMDEERFSTRALTAAIAPASLLEDYITAKDLSLEALERDPRSLEHLNGLVFALACLGELEEAKRHLRTLSSRVEPSSHNGFVTEANFGLLALRCGNPDQGKVHYRNAINGFMKLQNLAAERLARAYFAREAVVAGLVEAESLLKEAQQRNIHRAAPDAEFVIRAAERQLNDRNRQLSFK